MTDQELMGAIQHKYGEWIDEACRGTAFPSALLAALVANETGLEEGATRFEPGVYQDLSLVAIGRRAAFGEIGGADLQKYLHGLTAQAAILAVFNLATSWGPCQVMGWQALARGYPLAELSNLETHFIRVVEVLRDFGKQFPAIVPPAGVEIATGAWQPWFRCWNGGHPDAKTFDPNYAANGVRRLALYESLLV